MTLSAEAWPGGLSGGQVHEFGGLTVAAGPEVIQPRPWTIAQSRWAAELSAGLPAGPLLELCTGCGIIGLEAARLTGRAAVLVDASEDACRWARRNADDNGLGDRVDVRHAPAERAVEAHEHFPLILADPPYVPSAELGNHPEDPELAINGGDDGLDVAVTTMTVAAAHLTAGGKVLLQVRGLAQAAALEARIADDRSLAGLRMRSVRIIDHDRAVVLLDRG